MITPSFGLTATERVLPKLALDFTTASLDPRITFTRATGASNPATFINSSGVITTATNNQPRFDYDPVTLVCKGLLIEESRTNVLLNSDTLSTQSVTVTAAARTLSFYGTGQVVLSGAHSATVTGTGAYPTRTTLTFTPSAGTLTLTVTGTVQYAQLEAGAFATSYIPTTTTALTRNADVATMTGTNFSDWFNASEGTFQGVIERYAGATNVAQFIKPYDGTANNSYLMFVSSGSYRTLITTAGASQGQLLSGVSGPSFNTTLAYKTDDVAMSANAEAQKTDASVTLPVVDQMLIGNSEAVDRSLNGHFKKLNYWPQRLTNDEVLAFSK